MLDMLITLPWDFFTSGRNVFVTSIIPQRLTSAIRFNWSSGVHSIGVSEEIPALFTSPQIPESVINVNYSSKVDVNCKRYFKNNMRKTSKAFSEPA